ncbi:MAG TPA: conjugal transfer protein TraF [Nitrospira sp.]|nr:conjugal transfer protein TraF [Nitrospira sp.]
MKQLLVRVLGLTVLALVPTQVLAMEFSIVGPRAAGMGGAGVAVTTDSLATYWNPAGLAMTQTVDIRMQVTAQGVARNGAVDTFRNIEDCSSCTPADAQTYANQINGQSASVNGSAGLYIKGHAGNHAFGFNISDVAWAGSYPNQPFQATGATVTGQLAMRGLEARQAVFSYAYAFADKTFSIGVSGKLIQGAAYTGLATLTNGQDVTLSDHFGKAKISTGFGIDVGALYKPTDWLRLGVVAKDLTSPTFDAPNGEQFKISPQYRGGVAVNPYSSLTITFDGDILSNSTLVPNVKSQVLSLGAEQTLFSDLLSLRLGAYKNVADAASNVTPTAGFGLRIFAFQMDFGAGYDFKEGGVLGSGSLSLTF